MLSPSISLAPGTRVYVDGQIGVIQRSLLGGDYLVFFPGSNERRALNVRAMDSVVNDSGPVPIEKPQVVEQTEEEQTVTPNEQTVEGGSNELPPMDPTTAPVAS